LLCVRRILLVNLLMFMSMIGTVYCRMIFLALFLSQFHLFRLMFPWKDGILFIIQRRVVKVVVAKFIWLSPIQTLISRSQPVVVHLFLQLLLQHLHLYLLLQPVVVLLFLLLQLAVVLLFLLLLLLVLAVVHLHLLLVDILVVVLLFLV